MPTIYQLLDLCLDIGITEFDYWDMTFGEILRRLDSYERVKKREMREKAGFYYTLADLIGISAGRIMSDKVKYPEIYEAFSSLFTEEEIETSRQEERDRKMVEKLRQMAGMTNN